MPRTVLPDGYGLNYVTAGDSSHPALIFVHGYLSHHGVWKRTIAALKDRFFCVALDLLGFGDSEKPTAPVYGIAQQAQRVVQLADALGLEQFGLVGHSMGGQVGLCAAAMLAPERVTQVVSVAGVVSGHLQPRIARIGREMCVARYLPFLYALTRRLFNVPAFAYFQFGSWFYDIRSLPFYIWSEDRWRSMQPGCAYPNWAAWKAIAGLNLSAYLGDLTMPVLAIFGRQDAVVPLADGEMLAQRARHGRLVTFERCGHFPMYEAWEMYWAALCAFLTAGDCS
jgi:pimeloyl-ACP methyl ester carboxylesterase